MALDVAVAVAARHADVTGLGDRPVLARAIDARLFGQGGDVAIRGCSPAGARPTSTMDPIGAS